MASIRNVANNLDWFSAYITSISSQINEKVLPLPTVPTSISEQLSLNTYEQPIVGRSAPIVTYTSTGSRNINFTFAIADDYMPTNTSGNQYTIVSYTDALKSMVYPRYTDNEIIAPQIVVKIGNIKIAGILKSVSLTWNGPLSNILLGGCFSRADVSLQIQEVRASVLGSIDIKNGDY